MPAISVPNPGARWNHDSAVRLCWGVRPRSGVTRVRLTKERCQHHRHERVLKLTRGRRNRCERLPSDSWWDLRVSSCLARNCSRAERHHRRRQGHVGRGAAGRHRRSGERRADRERPSVVTDGKGVYRIVDLRPGIYIVTFTLAGFTTFKREGIELPSDFTATINADLKVGALEETVTVSRRRRRSSTCRPRCTRRCSTARRSTRFRPAAPSRAWASSSSASP